MKHFAAIIAVGNLLGFLAQAGTLLLINTRAPGSAPLWAALINVLALTVFFSQRSYARLIGWRSDDDAAEDEGPWPASPFDFWTGWVEHALFPWFLLGGNLILAGISFSFVNSYLEHQYQFERIAGIIVHPLSAFLWGLGLYKAGLVAANILFDILAVFGTWRRAYAWAMAAVIVVGLGVTTYVTVPDQIRFNRARSVWPNPEIITLRTGSPSVWLRRPATSGCRRTTPP